MTALTAGRPAALVALVLVLTAAASRAADDTRAFLDALRARKLFDVAVDHLEHLRGSGTASEDLNKTIDFELGVTLAESARHSRETASRAKALTEARTALTRFLEAQPNHALAMRARGQLAYVLVEQGRARADQAQRTKGSAEDRRRLTLEARALYAEADPLFAALETANIIALQGLPKFIPPDDRESRTQQRQATCDLIETRLAVATLAYETARTYPPGSEKNRDGLETSARRYHECYAKHNPLLAGLYARMWEGRSYRELGRYDEAMKIFAEILRQPDNPEAFRTLKCKALVLALETALLPQVGQYAEGAAMYRAWAAAARADETHSADVLAAKCLGGKAAIQYARTLRPESQATLRAEQIKLASEAFTCVSQTAGDYQAEAREQLRANEFSGGETLVSQTLTFAEAKRLALAALERMREAEAGIERDAADGKPGQRETLDPDFAAARDEALDYFRQALKLAPHDAGGDELNAIRYYLCYLYWASGQWREAAITGEFLARRYADSAGAKPSAKIAMAAYARLIGEAAPGEAALETGKMLGLAEFISARWAGAPEAHEAWMMVISAAAAERDLGKVKEYLDRIPISARQRAEAEIMAGQALWSEYLRAMRGPPSQRPKQAQLDALALASETILELGIARMQADRRGAPSPSLALAALASVQILVETGQAEKAIGRLSDPQVGPLALLTAEGAAVPKGTFAVEVYKAALRAQVATRDFDRATATLTAMEKHIKANGGEGNKRLIRAYLGLGRELQDQLDRLRQEKKTEQMESLSQEFDSLLTRVSQRPQGNNFSALHWMAETYWGLASGLAGPGGKPSPRAEACYRKAADSCRQILVQMDGHRFGAPPGAAVGVKLRLARCARCVGDYRAALTSLIELLKDRPNMVDAQIEAARTLQAWGSEEPLYFGFAIDGGQSYKEVWGWSGLARRLQSGAQHEDIFHESRYNMSLCRCCLAESLTGEQKAAVLAQAEADITSLQTLCPDMGGRVWSEKYNELLKKIQRLRASKPTGVLPSVAGGASMKPK